MEKNTRPLSPAEQALRDAALEYHRTPVRGKIAVTPTKPLSNQRDLSLAYSPGVAYACLAIEQDPAGGRMIQAGDDAQERRLAAARWAQNADEVVVLDFEVGALERSRRRAAAHTREHPAHRLDPQKAHGQSLWFIHLKTRSDTRPITPMQTMPKIIWPVSSSRWLSMIMWPMPLSAPTSSATIT